MRTSTRAPKVETTIGVTRPTKERFLMVADGQRHDRVMRQLLDFYLVFDDVERAKILKERAKSGA